MQMIITVKRPSKKEVKKAIKKMTKAEPVDGLLQKIFKVAETVTSVWELGATAPKNQIEKWMSENGYSDYSYAYRKQLYQKYNMTAKHGAYAGSATQNNVLLAFLKALKGQSSNESSSKLDLDTADQTTLNKYAEECKTLNPSFFTLAQGIDSNILALTKDFDTFTKDVQKYIEVKNLKTETHNKLLTLKAETTALFASFKNGYETIKKEMKDLYLKFRSRKYTSDLYEQTKNGRTTEQLNKDTEEYNKYNKDGELDKFMGLKGTKPLGAVILLATAIVLLGVVIVSAISKDTVSKEDFKKQLETNIKDTEYAKQINERITQNQKDIGFIQQSMKSLEKNYTDVAEKLKAKKVAFQSTYNTEIKPIILNEEITKVNTTTVTKQAEITKVVSFANYKSSILTAVKQGDSAVEQAFNAYAKAPEYGDYSLQSGDKDPFKVLENAGVTAQTIYNICVNAKNNWLSAIKEFKEIHRNILNTANTGYTSKTGKTSYRPEKTDIEKRIEEGKKLQKELEDLEKKKKQLLEEQNKGSDGSSGPLAWMGLGGVPVFLQWIIIFGVGAGIAFPLIRYALIGKN